jgi:hypothetical protein
MRVYKFLSSHFALQNIERKRLKISEFTDLNDPYELSGVDGLDDDIAEILIPHLQSYGLLCFSKNWNNPLLWSHYGDKHKGMCLGFDINTSVKIREPFYVEQRQKLGDVRAALQNYLAGRPQEFQAIIDKILLTKFRAWNYEDEVRVFLRRANQDGDYYFYLFDENIRLTQVIAGLRCDVPSNTIEEKLRSYPEHIEIVKAKLSPNSFEVIADPDFSQC